MDFPIKNGDFPEGKWAFLNSKPKNLEDHGHKNRTPEACAHTHPPVPN